MKARNIIGKRGSGPIAIVGAHYDTRRQADDDPDPANHTQPVIGANGGASGVAVLWKWRGRSMLIRQAEKSG